MKHERAPLGMNPHQWRKFEKAQRNAMLSMRRGKRRTWIKWVREMNRQFKHVTRWIETPRHERT